MERRVQEVKFDGAIHVEIVFNEAFEDHWTLIVHTLDQNAELILFPEEAWP